MARRPDLPFYAGDPVPISGPGWLVVLVGLGLGFAALVLIPAQTFPATLVPALLFLAIPLLALAVVAGRGWTALFGRVGLREVGLMFLMGVATILASAIVAVILSRLVPLVPNPVAGALAEMTAAQLATRLLPTLPQLVGEELLAILPFLAVLWLATQRLGLSRRAGTLLALVSSSLLFGAAHLPTYDWHWGQALGVIGAARVVLTLAYLWTRNLWVPAGAHVVNDWSEFALGFVGSHLPIGTE